MLGYHEVVGILDSVLTSLFPPKAEPLADVRPGAPVLVQGYVVARDIITSPLTEERCVYYQYTVEQWRRARVAGFSGDGFWELQESDEAIAEFYLQDGEQRAIIAPHNARVERGRGVYVRKVDMGIDSQRAQQLLIVPGDRIEVTGIAEQTRDLHDEERNYRSRPDRLIITAPKDQQLLIRLLRR